MEFQLKYRPKKLSDIFGQQQAITVLADLVKREAVPHTMLFSGESGCGKTTLARILAKRLRCSKQDLVEMNAAKERGIDVVRDATRTMNLAPIGGGDCRVFIIDEAHQMTTQAQEAFLKPLEEPPAHVYFMLCTTDADKLKKAIRTRCLEVRVTPLADADLVGLLDHVCKKEELSLDEDVRDSIVKAARGCARQALVILNSIAGLDNADEQREAVQRYDVEGIAIEIARKLFNPRTQWKEMAATLKPVTEDAESLRWMILGYAKAILLNGKQDARAYEMLRAFRDPFYDSKHAGLVAACWEVIVGDST